MRTVVVVLFVWLLPSAALAGYEIQPHISMTQYQRGGPNCSESSTSPEVGAALGVSTVRFALGIRFGQVMGESPCGRLRQGATSLYLTFGFLTMERSMMGLGVDWILYTGGTLTQPDAVEIDLSGGGGFTGELFYQYQFDSEGRIRRDGEDYPAFIFSFVLRAGYRTFDSAGTTFAGPYGGVALNIYMNPT